MPKPRTYDGPSDKTSFNFPRGLLKAFRLRCLELDNKPQSEAFIEAVTTWLSATGEVAVPVGARNRDTNAHQAGDPCFTLSTEEFSYLSAMLGVLRSPNALAHRLLKGVLDA